jgi:hypothetical protein
MPSDDLVLNVKQIAGYPAVSSALGTDALLLQRGGLGGPYQSISPEALTATALLTSSQAMQVGVAAPGDADGAQVFTAGLATPLGGWWLWNAYVSTASTNNRMASGPAGLIQFDPVNGWLFYSAPPGAAGAPLDGGEVNIFGISLAGHVTVGDQVSLARDPAAPMEAATARWVGASTVASFNSRQGAVRLTLSDILGAGGAPIYSPFFGGTPRAETPPPWSSSNRLATTAFVTQAVAAVLASDVLVSSFNTRTGAVVLTQADITAAGGATAAQLALYAPIDSPNFTGYATSLTPPPGTADGQIATCAFVMNAVEASTTGVASFNTRTGVVTLLSTDLTTAGGALLLSPAFTGTPTAPTPPPGDNSTRLATTGFVAASGTGSWAPLNSPAFTGVPTAPTAPLGTSTTQIATTAFVMNEITAVDAGVLSFNGRTGSVVLLANDISAAGGATLQSPVFTGTPTAPTANAGTSSAQIATTAFVTGAIGALPAPPVASTVPPLINGAATAGTSAAWSRGDHVHPTDTTRAAASALASYLPLSGGSLTGNLSGTTAGFTGNVNCGSLHVNLGTINCDGTVTGGASGQFSGPLNGQSLAATGPSGTAAIYPSYNVDANYYLLGTTGARLIQFAAGYTLQVDLNNHLYQFVVETGLATTIDASGSLTITGNGFKPGGGAWTATSDARIKTIAGDYTLGLEEIVQLEPVLYRYKGNDAPPKGDSPHKQAIAASRTFVGLVAQAVEGVFPGMVTKGEGWIDGDKVTDLRSLNTTELVFALVNAVKTLAARVTALEAA